MSRPRLPRRAARAVAYTLAAVALGGWLVVHLTVLWVTAHPAVLAAGVVLAGGIGYLKTAGAGPAPPSRARAERGFLDLDAGQFEEAVAELCRRDGCTDVRVVGGSGDLGADVIATTPTGRRMVVQCKRYAPGRRVGSPDVQRVGGTYAVVHGAELALVVTTAAFTPAAEEYARAAGIRLVDGEELAAWAAGRLLPPWGGERMMGK
ncbi:restriction endonuclease [Streptomyces sp. V4-01]|uniref:Restriction endonuclease n=1 Tax=Actinacidiphila polyblastidii TaxID=3110430 RepID=A0ABU7PMI9_9ACTN|nr:restriction endonuclease [Streptomyces sp. V4-01]